jgi:hypothetical protein
MRAHKILSVSDIGTFGLLPRSALSFRRSRHTRAPSLWGASTSPRGILGVTSRFSRAPPARSCSLAVPVDRRPCTARNGLTRGRAGAGFVGRVLFGRGRDGLHGRQRRPRTVSPAPRRPTAASNQRKCAGQRAGRCSFDEARVELSRLLRVEEATDVPVLVLANKSDVEGSQSAEGVAAALDVQGLDRELEVFSCSLVSGSGYVEAFRWLSARL